MSIRQNRTALLLATMACAALLSGCGGDGVEEVKVWMKQETEKARPSVKPLPETKEFVAAEYTSKEQVEPFNPAKLLVVLDRLSAKNSSGLKPDRDRNKELLESFPLDTIKMVGVLQKKGVIIGLVQVDKSLFQVKAGQYLGQNEGKITKISETQIDIKELVQDPTGDWVERAATLELQENKK
ncbi:pilus assembly protein PilP [Massilia sp. W12]|uniref:pilus assembly protein PilP n=1 Tax=Massilia sp. W12 TaxID=3126507 RepID=UPI0030D08877